MNIELHIDRLVLDGLPLPPGGAGRPGRSAFGRELGRLRPGRRPRRRALLRRGTPRLTATLSDLRPAAAGGTAGLGTRVAGPVGLLVPGRELTMAVIAAMSMGAG